MSTSEDEIVNEIVEMHVKNGLEIVNRASNSFIIYRKCHMRNSKLSSKLAGESWKNESNEIKDRYERIAKNVRERLAKIVPSHHFIHSKPAGTNDNEVNPPMDLNFPNTIRHNCPLNMDQNSSGTTYYNPPMVQNSPDITCPGPRNTSDIMNMDQNSLDTASIYSGQQSYPPMDQNFTGITFPDPDQIIDYYPFTNINKGTFFYPHMDQNSTFLNSHKIIDINQGTFYNSSLSNIIYSGLQSVNIGLNSPYDYSYQYVNQICPDITYQNPLNTDYSDDFKQH